MYKEHNISSGIEERRRMARYEVYNELAREDWAEDETLIPELKEEKDPNLFSLKKYMREHPDEDIQVVCNFNREELKRLKELVKPCTCKMKKRGIGTKSRIFMNIGVKKI